jgi:hypothetical protein
MNHQPDTSSSCILVAVAPRGDVTSVGARSGQVPALLQRIPKPRQGPENRSSNAAPGLSGFSVADIPFGGSPRLTDTTPGSISVNRTRLTRAKLSLDSIRNVFRLAARVDGWRGAGSRSLESGSLSTFLEFWTSFTSLKGRKEPAFTLAANGNLIAEWYKNKNRHLDIEFCSDGQLYFGLFNGKSVLEGIATGDELALILGALLHSPLKWSDA